MCRAQLQAWLLAPPLAPTAATPAVARQPLTVSRPPFEHPLYVGCAGGSVGGAVGGTVGGAVGGAVGGRVGGAVTRGTVVRGAVLAGATVPVEACVETGGSAVVVLAGGPPVVLDVAATGSGCDVVLAWATAEATVVATTGAIDDEPPLGADVTTESLAAPAEPVSGPLFSVVAQPSASQAPARTTATIRAAWPRRAGRPR